MGAVEAKYMGAVEANLALMEIRLADWVARHQCQRHPGAAEVAPWSAMVRSGHTAIPNVL
jgi:hypothetical protein